MIALDAGERGAGLTLLLLGAHSDDIEIGCGGTVLKVLKERDDVTVHWVVFSASGEREQEARESAERFLRGARDSTVEIQAFRDGFFPYVGAEIKEVFESLKAVDPDVIFTHFRDDLHQDHRLLNELTWNTFRSHLVLEYEVPKYDGDLGSPNVFVPLEAEIRKEKVDLLLELFGSQRSKSWFTRETFEGLMRLRGIECPGPAQGAEAFYGRKLVFAP